MMDARLLTIMTEATFLLAERNPGLAVRTVARAIKSQSAGGKVALVQQLVSKLAEDEGTEFTTAAAQALAALARRD